MKEEFIKGSKGYETDWLGDDISISDEDLPVYNLKTGGLNKIELKRYQPIMNLVQIVEFEKGRIHIVVHFSLKRLTETGKKEFRAERYLLYCSSKPHHYEKEFYITNKGERRFKGYHLIQDAKIEIRDPLKMREIFRADSKFPCCDRFSEHLGMEEVREILK